MFKLFGMFDLIQLRSVWSSAISNSVLQIVSPFDKNANLSYRKRYMGRVIIY